MAPGAPGWVTGVDSSAICLDSESLEGSRFGHPAFEISVGPEGYASRWVCASEVLEQSDGS